MMDFWEGVGNIGGGGKGSGSGGGAAAGQRQSADLVLLQSVERSQCVMLQMVMPQSAERSQCVMLQMVMPQSSGAAVRRGYRW